MQPEDWLHVLVPSLKPVLAEFHESFMDPPPQPRYSPLSPWMVRRAIVDRHIEPFEEVLDNFCGELRAWVAA